MMFWLRVFLQGVLFSCSLASTTKCTINHDIENGVQVDCQGKGLTDIPKDFPVNTTSINLSSNLITTVPNYSFIGTPNLKSLDLSNNDISIIESHAFLKCDSLKGIDITRNKICLNGSVFKHLENLQEMAIDDCYDAEVLRPLSGLTKISIKTYNECGFEGFDYLSNLRSLVILGVFSCKNETFVKLRNLRILSLRIQSHLSRMDINALSPLVYLRELTFINTKSGLSKPLEALYPLVGRNLSTLILNDVKITEGSQPVSDVEDRILTKERLKYLSQICISHFAAPKNRILFVDVEYIENSPISKCLTHVTLSHNMFNHLPIQALLLLWTFTNLEYVDFSNQGRLFKSPSSTLNKPLFFDFSIKHTPVKGGAVLKIPEKLTTVIVKSVSGHVGHIDFDITVSRGDNITKIDFSFNGLGIMNHLYGIPNIEYVDLSGNEELVLPNDFFCSSRKLESLKLSDMSLRQNILDVQAAMMLKCLPKLRILDISGNRLVQLPSDLFKLNPLLEHLDLSRNIFTSIPVHLSILPNLHLLDLSSNSFGHLDKMTTDDIDKHFVETGSSFQLQLGGNYFECSCVNFDLLSWLSETNSLSNSNDLLCITEDGNIVKTGSITSSIVKFWRKCNGAQIFAISTIFGSFLLCSILVGLLIDTNKTKFVYFLINALKYQVPKQWRKDFKKDVFLSYADADYRWACHELGAILEERNLNLFIWDRDSVPGDCTAEVITETVNQCWKTILYFTENYERDAWSYLTTMAAINCVDNLNPERLILLLPENENPRVPECLLQVVPESCIFHIPQNIDKNHEFWDQLEGFIKKEP